MVSLTCEHCGKIYERIQRTSRGGKPKRFCSPRCRYDHLSGERHANFKGGRYVPESDKEYIAVLHHGHSRAHRNRVKEHILVAEQMLGGPLPKGAEVHHLDSNTKNNLPDNLYVCRDRHHHMVLEAAMRRLAKMGSLVVKPCHSRAWLGRIPQESEELGWQKQHL